VKKLGREEREIVSFITFGYSPCCQFCIIPDNNFRRLFRDEKAKEEADLTEATADRFSRQASIPLTGFSHPGNGSSGLWGSFGLNEQAGLDPPADERFI
jgi:hypothetical protein